MPYIRDGENITLTMTSEEVRAAALDIRICNRSKTCGRRLFHFLEMDRVCEPFERWESRFYSLRNSGGVPLTEPDV